LKISAGSTLPVSFDMTATIVGGSAAIDGSAKTIAP
jgi:hypothetical protein